MCHLVAAVAEIHFLFPDMAVISGAIYQLSNGLLCFLPDNPAS
jgi:hypothetical protein